MSDGMMDNMKSMTGMMSGGMMDKMEAMTKEMKDTLSGLEGDEFDKRFLEMVSMHHQQAIEMSRLAEDRAAHSEVKGLAAEMIQEQAEEMEKMQSWQELWGYTEEG